MLGPAVLVVMPAADGEVAPDVEPLRHGHGRGLVAVHGDGQKVPPFHHLHLLTIMNDVGLMMNNVNTTILGEYLSSVALSSSTYLTPFAIVEHDSYDHIQLADVVAVAAMVFGAEHAVPQVCH